MVVAAHRAVQVILITDRERGEGHAELLPPHLLPLTLPALLSRSLLGPKEDPTLPSSLGLYLPVSPRAEFLTWSS